MATRGGRGPLIRNKTVMMVVSGDLRYNHRTSPSNDRETRRMRYKLFKTPGLSSDGENQESLLSC